MTAASTGLCRKVGAVIYWAKLDNRTHLTGTHLTLTEARAGERMHGARLKHPLAHVKTPCPCQAGLLCLLAHLRVTAESRSRNTWGTPQTGCSFHCQHNSWGWRWARPGKATAFFSACVGQVWGQTKRTRPRHLLAYRAETGYKPHLIELGCNTL